MDLVITRVETTRGQRQLSNAASRSKAYRKRKQAKNNTMNGVVDGNTIDATQSSMPAGSLSASAPPSQLAPAAPMATASHSIPLLLHLLGPEAAKNARGWAAHADGFMIKMWKDDELKACRKLVPAFASTDAYDLVLPADTSATAKMPRSETEKTIIDKLVILFLYGGIVTNTAKTPTLPITFACDQYRDAIVILFALDDGAKLDTSMIMSSARVRAFETLFDMASRGRAGQLEIIVKEFFRSAIQSSPSHTIRVIDSNALKLLYGELPLPAAPVGESSSGKASTSNNDAAEVLIAHGGTEKTMEHFRGHTVFAIGKPTALSDAVIQISGKSEASNAGVAQLIVLDDAAFDPDALLQVSINLATMFQQAMAVAKAGTKIAIARHGGFKDNEESGERHYSDALVAPQLKILKANLLAQDESFGVWQLMN